MGNYQDLFADKIKDPGIFSRIIESVRDAVVLINGESKVLYWNKAAEEMFGYAKDEILGKDLYDFITLAKCSREHLEGMEKFKETGKGKFINQIIEVAALKKDKTEFPVELSISPLRIDDKWHAVGIVRDIAERKRAEEALSEAHERAAWLARFSEENPSPVARVSTDGIVLYRNATAAELPGWKCEVGRSLPDLLLPLVKRVRAEAQEVQQEVELSGRFYSVSVVPFPAESYADIRGTDITERKGSEEALRESAERYRELADSLPQIVFETDLKSNFTFANRFAFSSTGYTQDDFSKGLNVLQMFVPADRDRVKENMRKVFSGEHLKGTEYTVQRKDGSIFPVMVYSGLIVRENKIMGLRGIAVDVTEYKKAEEKEKAHNEELERVNRLMVGRELKMTELKKEIESLNKKIGQGGGKR